MVNIIAISVLFPTPDFFRHAEWFGVTFFDLIFPLFVTLSGCGLAFAYRNRVGWGATLRRSVILLAVGLVYNVAIAGSLDVATLRVTGPLQIYAVLVLVIGVLHLWARTPWAWAGITLVVAAAQAFVLAAWQAGCPTEQLRPECNPSRVVDVAVFGASHIYHAGEFGHDPEGLMSVLGALVTACVGTTAGHLVLATRGTRAGPWRLIVWSTLVLAAAFALNVELPAMKRLWTTPFALGVAAVGVLILAVGVVVMDWPARRRWERVRTAGAWPLIALGRNSLLVYFGSHLVLHVLLTRGGDEPWAQHVAMAVDLLGHPRASFVVLMLALWVGLTALLHRFRIYLRP